MSSTARAAVAADDTSTFRLPVPVTINLEVLFATCCIGGAVFVPFCLT